MTSTVTRDTLFKPNPTRTESKASETARVAFAVISAEQVAREKKTARLKAARLAQSAAATPPKPAPKRRKTTAKS
jgi:hypothetical protein